MEDLTPRNPSMQFNNQPKNNSRRLALVVVVALIIIGIVFIVVNRGSDTETENITQTQDQSDLNRSDRDNKLDRTEEPGTLRGILLKSDNEKQGNLVLVRLSGDIYLRTSRDFSSLLNQEVVVRIDGDLKKFRLVDITLD